MTDDIRTEFPRSNLWCEKHWTQIRKIENINGICSSLRLMHHLMEDKEFMQKCDGKVELVNEKMVELGPVCCYLGENILNQICKECRKV